MGKGQLNKIQVIQAFQLHNHNRAKGIAKFTPLRDCVIPLHFDHCTSVLSSNFPIYKSVEPLLFQIIDISGILLTLGELFTRLSHRRLNPDIILSENTIFSQRILVYFGKKNFKARFWRHQITIATKYCNNSLIVCQFLHFKNRTLLKSE